LLHQELKFAPVAGLEERTGRPPKSSAKPDKKAKKRKYEKDEDSESEDEVSAFKARPSASVNRTMIIPPVERQRKQAIELSMAQVDPNASFAERVAQFDNMEALAKKRKFRLF
jgi:hypothetical protein